MKLKYLLDTNIVSEPLKATPSGKVLDTLNDNEIRCAISSITWHELNYGLARLPVSPRKEMIYSYLTTVLEPAFPILSYDSKSSLIHAELRAFSEAEGRSLPFADSQIASIALANQLILVTRNTKDFSRFKNLEIENWFN